MERLNLSEIVLKEIKMRMFKDPLATNEMNKHVVEDSDLNKDNFKIRELSKNSFYVGEIFVNNQYYGAFGLEKEYWGDKSTPEMDFLDRIIIKLYDRQGKAIGMIEERVLRELMQSAVSGTLPTFTISLQGIPYMIDIEKEAGKLIFPLLVNKTQKIFEIFEFAKKALRDDYVVTRKLADQKVADIDSQRGGKIAITVYDSEISNNKIFTDILALFAATIKFHDEIGKKIETAMESLKTGSLVLKPPTKALELMVNPRKAKRLTKVTDEEDEDKPAESKEEAKERAEVRRKSKRKVRGAKEEEEAAPEEEEKEGETEEKPKLKKKQLKTVKKEDLKAEKFDKLLLQDPVEKASGVNKAIAQKLESVGLFTVEDLLTVDPVELAAVLEDDSITATKIKRWITASRKRIRATLDEAESYPEDAEDYDLIDYGF